MEESIMIGARLCVAVGLLVASYHIRELSRENRQFRKTLQLIWTEILLKFERADREDSTHSQQS